MTDISCATCTAEQTWYTGIVAGVLQELALHQQPSCYICLLEREGERRREKERGRGRRREGRRTRDRWMGKWMVGQIDGWITFYSP